MINFTVVLLGVCAILTSGMPTNLTNWPSNWDDAHFGGVARTPIAGYIQNNCNFPIYVRQSLGPGSGQPAQDTPIEYLPGGKSGWWAPVRSGRDGRPTTMKISRGPYLDPAKQYQIEWNVDVHGNIWFNLSHENGYPFNDVARFLEVKGDGCQAFFCGPGYANKNCEWPDQLGTCVAENVMFYLC